MASLHRLLLFLLFVALNEVAKCDPPFVGRWVEDETQRTGLNDFLWARGVNWFKRQYAAKLTTWQYEQTIIQSGDSYRISGLQGPYRDVFSYTLTPNNVTVDTIDVGEIGGQKLATAEIKDNSMITYLQDPTTGVIDLIATRTIAPENPNVMHYKTKDVPNGYEMVAVMKRQN